MNLLPRPYGSEVLSYRELRYAVGVIGILLPVVLAIGKVLLESPGIQSSISAYYYTVMRDVFVGSLCAIAIFFFAYRYSEVDSLVGNVACVFVLGVAWLPIAPDVNATPLNITIGRVHQVCAAGFFLTLAAFCLWLFRLTDKNKPPTREKIVRNRVYFWCGLVIIACVVLVAVVSFIADDSWIKRWDPVFVLETIAIEAFGLAWFTKGDGIPFWNDPVTKPSA